VSEVVRARRARVARRGTRRRSAGGKLCALLKSSHRSAVCAPLERLDPWRHQLHPVLKAHFFFFFFFFFFFAEEGFLKLFLFFSL
jgi:hypothetical protein